MLFAYIVLLTLICCLKLFLTDDEPTGLTLSDVRQSSSSPSAADLSRERARSLNRRAVNSVCLNSRSSSFAVTVLLMCITYVIDRLSVI